MGKPRLLILGGGLWQVEYVRRARALGLETWVTDWSADAPARPDADHFEEIDLRDREGTLALARTVKIDGVMTAADVGVPTAAFVAQELRLPGHPLALAERATNKCEMRRHADRSGIPCPRWERVRSAADAAGAVARLGLPVIVKPVDNWSSRGVTWVDRAADVARAAGVALGASFRHEALVEEFLVGTEGSIEALVEGGRAIVLGVCDKTKSPLPDRFDLELRYPGAYDATTAATLRTFAQRLTDAYAVDNGILHIEFLVSSMNQGIYLIEFALRGCGSRVVTHLIPALTGVNAVDIVIQQAFGRSSSIDLTRAGHGALHFLMFPSGLIAAVRGVADAAALPGVIDVCVERRPGESIGEVHDGRSRPGHVLVEGPDARAVQDTLARVRSCIRVDYAHRPDVAPAELPAMSSCR